MAVAVADKTGNRLVGMAVSADGLTFQYLGSLSQILDLSAFTGVRSPTLTRTAAGRVRLWLIVTKADGTTGVATASLPPAAVTCVQANPRSP